MNHNDRRNAYGSAIVALAVLNTLHLLSVLNLGDHGVRAIAALNGLLVILLITNPRDRRAARITVRGNGNITAGGSVDGDR